MSVTSTVVDGAETRFIEAAEVLRPFVGCFWIITAERGAAIRVVPDASTAISVHLQDNESSEWVLRGPLVRPQELRFPAAATLVGVRLRPGVAYLVSGISADTLLHRRLKLSGLLFDACASDGCASRTPQQNIDVLQRFLIERLTGASVHGVVAAALDAIQRAHGCARVADVAAECGVSERHLNRLMRTWIGYGPKRFGRVVRFQETLKEIEQAPALSGAALASETGYFDQAHLTLDMTQMAGDTPGHMASQRVADFYKTRCDGPL